MYETTSKWSSLITFILPTDQRFGDGLRGQFITAPLDHSTSAVGAQTWVPGSGEGSMRVGCGVFWKLPWPQPRRLRELGVGPLSFSDTTPSVMCCLFRLPPSWLLQGGRTSYLSAQSAQHIRERLRERDTTSSLQPSLRRHVALSPQYFIYQDSYQKAQFQRQGI